MALTDTKSKRLAIILGVVAAYVVVQVSVAYIGGSRARAAAEDLAPQVEALVGDMKRDDAELLAAKAHAAAYAGQDLAPFRVADVDPQARGDHGSYTLSYEVSRWASQRCVEARWRDEGTPVIWVTRCGG